MHEGQQQLTDQHSDQICHDSEFRYAKEYEGQPDQKGDDVLDKCGGSLPKAVQDAAHGGRQVKKWAEPGQRLDKSAGIFVFEHTDAEVISKDRENRDAEDSHVEAVA